MWWLDEWINEDVCLTVALNFLAGGPVAAPSMCHRLFFLLISTSLSVFRSSPLLRSLVITGYFTSGLREQGKHGLPSPFAIPSLSSFFPSLSPSPLPFLVVAS